MPGRGGGSADGAKGRNKLEARLFHSTHARAGACRRAAMKTVTAIDIDAIDKCCIFTNTTSVFLRPAREFQICVIASRIFESLVFAIA
jgi:hypothetical protein